MSWWTTRIQWALKSTSIIWENKNHPPRIETLKLPKRSPDNESPPHWSTMAEGWYVSMIFVMTCWWLIQFTKFQNQGKVNKKGIDANWLKDVLVSLIGDTISQWEIDSIVLPFPMAGILLWHCSSASAVFDGSQQSENDMTNTKFTRARKEFAILVKTACHYSIGRVKCLLHAITVMHVNVNIKHAFMVPIRVGMDFLVASNCQLSGPLSRCQEL